MDAQVIGKTGAVEQALEETGIRDLVVDDQDASLCKIVLSHWRELNLTVGAAADAALASLEHTKVIRPEWVLAAGCDRPFR